jgi:GAF domain-containing protein
MDDHTGTTSTPPSAAQQDQTLTLQSLVLNSDAVADFLTTFTHYVAEHLSTEDRAVLCGVTLIRPRLQTTVASNSPRAQAMDEIQYAFGDGPCLHAARTRSTNYVPDVQDKNQPWPRYGAAVAEHGLRSILAVPIPLHAGSDTGCAINLYADTIDAFSDSDITAVQTFAEEAATTVRLAVRIALITETAQNLRAAMNSRTSIDLAAGIVMAQNRCSQDTAMTILKAASSARNIKLRDLAGSVIATVTGHPTSTHFDN